MAISDLLTSYALYLDQGRMDEWLDVFLPDAVMNVPGSPPIRTHQDRLAMAAASPLGTHVCAPPLIRVGANPDEAIVEQAYVFRGSAKGPILSGWYEDVVVKRTGRWQIASRQVRFARRPPRPASE